MNGPTTRCETRFPLVLLAALGGACGGDRGVDSPERGAPNDADLDAVATDDGEDDAAPADAAPDDSAADSEEPDDGATDADANDTDGGDVDDSAGGCTPGSRTCAGDLVQQCSADGGGFETVESCSGACVGGACAPPCGGDEKSYLGCDFVAVDLDNFDDASTGFDAAAQPWAVTVSNPNDRVVSVEFADGRGARVAGPIEVAPGAVERVRLPRADADATSLTFNSFRIVSSAPVTAHQFNPENNVDVYSNDATLLLPASALGLQYLVLGWPTEVQQVPLFGPRVFRSFVTIVGVAATTTDVTIRTPATAAIAAGPGFDALAAGSERRITLQRGQTLALTTTEVNRADLTGMEIVANYPVAVFAGAECANVPLGNTYCDHIEEQLTPVSAWGTEYVAANFEQRGREPSVYRILASSDGTVVTVEPPQPGFSTATLARGRVVEIVSDADFVIRGTAPISVAQFMVGSSYPGPAEGCTRDPESTLPSTCAIPSDDRCIQGSGIGDPASMMLVPSRQLRSDYVVLTPRDYFENYLTLIVPESGAVNLDGVAVAGDSTPIGSTGWSVLRVPVNEGSHTLRGTAPFGLYAYGYECDVSYAYAGGMNLAGSP